MTARTIPGSSVRQDRENNDMDAIGGGFLPAPRGETESLVEYFDRIRSAIMAAGRFADDSTELIRQSRQERTDDLLRAAGLEDWVEE